MVSGQGRTYANIGAAAADPNSNISRFLRDATVKAEANNRVIAQWMETGLTHEQAWAKAIFSLGPKR